MLLRSHKARKMWPPLKTVGEKMEILVVSHMISQNTGFGVEEYWGLC